MFVRHLVVAPYELAHKLLVRHALSEQHDADAGLPEQVDHFAVLAATVPCEEYAVVLNAPVDDRLVSRTSWRRTGIANG